MADIEERLDTMSPRVFTVALLTTYESDLNGIISMLRNVSDAEIRNMKRQSSGAVLTYIRDARDQLALAIGQLEKGFNSRYVTYLKSCRKNLEEALKRW